MKRVFLGMLALTTLFASSCERDLALGADSGKTVSVSLNVTTPSIANRAYSDGFTATHLQYAVYDEQGTELTALTVTNGEIHGNTTVNLQLVTGNTYSVLFWAAAPNAPYTVNLANKSMTVDYTTAVSNDESRDAFYYYNTFTVNGAMTLDAELKRPFAQLNIGSSDYAAAASAGYIPTTSAVTVKNIYNTIDFTTGAVSNDAEVTFATNAIPQGETFPVAGHDYLAMNYLLVGADQATIDVIYTYTNAANDSKSRTVGSVPVQRNYRTNLYGALLTSNVAVNVEIVPEYVEDNKYGAIDGETYATVSNVNEFNAAFTDGVNTIILSGDIALDSVLTRAADPSLKVTQPLTIDLGGYTLSATSTQSGKNYNMFDVRDNLTIKNGNLVYEHKGDNMTWDHSTNLFHVEGGTLNLEGVTAKNLGGSDMSFVVHLNNWAECTLNVENSTLESTYVPVRVFNSGPYMNNITIKNSTLNGGNYAFWVHNYTAADFGSEAKAEAQKALLNLNIYDQGNTFSPDVNGIRYGFSDTVKTDAQGITCIYSDDNTTVTLGTLVEDGVIRRGVAGEEENTTITKAIVEDGVAVLYDRTFRRFYALETVELPNTLTAIGITGTGVFQSCSSLKNIVIPESVTTLGAGTFQECTSLTSINIPSGITRIEANTLRNTGLVSVEFHEGVTYFGAQAFRDCDDLNEIIIKAPAFTVETNTFINVAAPYPTIKIYVANAEMKAYLESKLDSQQKSFITVVAPSEATTTEDLKAVLASDAKIVSVAAGEYTFPANSVKEGTTINCAEGTVFTGTSSLNISGATVVGATFKNEGGQAVSGTINGIFKDCTFEGNETFRWCYTSAGESVVFENCIVKSSLRGIHFDEMNGDITFKNCEINGFNAYSGSGSMTFENCTFGYDKSNYNGLNIYTNTTLKDCTFNFVSGKTNFIDMEGTGKTLTIINCAATLDGAPVAISDFVGGSKLAENSVIIQ